MLAIFAWALSGFSNVYYGLALRVRDLIVAHTDSPTFGFLGRARVNVLELNLALDQTFGAPAPTPAGN